MRPDQRTFDRWWELYFVSQPGSDDWWDSIDNMFKRAECLEDWRRIHEILEWEEHGQFREYFSRARNYEPWRIATNGMMFVLPRAKLEELRRLAARPWWQKAFDAVAHEFRFQSC